MEDTSIQSKWSEAIVVTVSSTAATFNLVLASKTNGSVPGIGGMLDPSAGTYSFSRGSSLDIKAIPSQNYRFSRWIGDISKAEAYDTRVSLFMDRNWALTASFCPPCGDINGDLMISPADAQIAMDIYMGKIRNPDFWEMENGDVNSDGTKAIPRISPKDAQHIFYKYLNKVELPGNCSGISRGDGIFTQADDIAGFKDEGFIEEIHGYVDEDVIIPILLDRTLEIGAFGLDIIFSSEFLDYIAIEETAFSKRFHQVEINLVEKGRLRIGGYNHLSLKNQGPCILIALVFRVTRTMQRPATVSIEHLVDDLEHGPVRIGKPIRD